MNLMPGDMVTWFDAFGRKDRKYTVGMIIGTTEKQVYVNVFWSTRKVTRANIKLLKKL